MMKKICLIFCLCLFTLGLFSCKKNTDDPEKVNPNPNQDVEDNNDNHDDNNHPNIPTPDLTKKSIGIKGGSEVRSGYAISLKSEISGTDDKAVKWEIIEGADYASISEKGKLQAKSVDGDKIIKVRCSLANDTSVYAEKIITIVSKPVLTQSMLDELNVDKIGFDGYVNINLYTIGLFEKLYSTTVTVIKTAMDGENWYAEYENASTSTIMGLYYKNHDDIACEVGVSFMNDEQYFPMENDNGRTISWTDSGLYNSLKNLKIEDFVFNEEIWRYEYAGPDALLAERVIASANPYDFIVDNFSLIIDESEVLGIYAKSKEDYGVVPGYKAIQELIVAVNSEKSVKVPTISKYSHEDIHDELGRAIKNMQSLNSYHLTFKEITASYLTSGYVQSGYEEIITKDECYYTPYQIDYDKKGNEIKTINENERYGFKKISDNLYNAYNEEEDNTFRASRAYEGDMSQVKPTFAFAPEIFRTYYIDEEEGTTTYYADDLMSRIASTLYFGMGNDINLYGIFATRGYTSQTESFTPYVVVKDGYITDACFYFYMGSIFGVVELTYSEFDTAEIPSDVDVSFIPRQVPTSWSDVTIQVSNDDTSTSEDEEVNALEYLKTFYNDENIDNNLPFFGNVLGDTYGFGLTTIHMPQGTNVSKKSIVFYYDVPLDIDYTIDGSLKKIDDFLLSKGFEKNGKGEFNKGDIWIAPMDSSLDLVIYVWKK